jgi:hypothetical protein
MKIGRPTLLAVLVVALICLPRMSAEPSVTLGHSTNLFLRSMHATSMP